MSLNLQESREDARSTVRKTGSFVSQLSMEVA